MHSPVPSLSSLDPHFFSAPTTRVSSIQLPALLFLLPIPHIFLSTQQLLILIRCQLPMKLSPASPFPIRSSPSLFPQHSVGYSITTLQIVYICIHRLAFTTVDYKVLKVRSLVPILYLSQQRSRMLYKPDAQTCLSYSVQLLTKDPACFTDHLVSCPAT